MTRIYFSYAVLDKGLKEQITALHSLLGVLHTGMAIQANQIGEEMINGQRNWLLETSFQPPDRTAAAVNARSVYTRLFVYTLAVVTKQWFGNLAWSMMTDASTEVGEGASALSRSDLDTLIETTIKRGEGFLLCTISGRASVHPRSQPKPAPQVHQGAQQKFLVNTLFLTTDNLQFY